jgi:hypothetical protein
MIDFTPIIQGDYNTVTLLLKGIGPVNFDTTSKFDITDTEVRIVDVDVPMKNAQGVPDATATLTQVLDKAEIAGFVLTKKNLIKTVPPGLVLSKGGQA